LINFQFTLGQISYPVFFLKPTVTASKSFKSAASIDSYVSSATITKQNFNLPSDLVGPDIVYLLSKRMSVGHDFLTHFTQYSKFENTNCQLSGIK
jgi:hypothetical protein